MAQDDLAGWKLVTEALGAHTQLVGDDVFCTNASLLTQGIDDGIANSILVKVNQLIRIEEELGSQAVYAGGRSLSTSR